MNDNEMKTITMNKGLWRVAALALDFIASEKFVLYLDGKDIHDETYEVISDHIKEQIEKV